MRSITFHLEYLWLDGNYPQQIRSKTKIVEKEITEDIIEKIQESETGDIREPFFHYTLLL